MVTSLLSSVDCHWKLWEVNEREPVDPMTLDELVALPLRRCMKAEEEVGKSQILTILRMPWLVGWLVELHAFQSENPSNPAGFAAKLRLARSVALPTVSSALWEPRLGPKLVEIRVQLAGSLVNLLKPSVGLELLAARILEGPSGLE